MIDGIVERPAPHAGWGAVVRVRSLPKPDPDVHVPPWVALLPAAIAARHAGRQLLYAIVRPRPRAEVHLLAAGEDAGARAGPLHLRLASALRTAIRSGRLPSGAALPASRVLAADLGVSRWTVTQAYGQLVTEGYLAGRTGSATRVRWSPEPDDGPVARPAHASHPARYDLSQCTPDYRAFPRTRWVESCASRIATAVPQAPSPRTAIVVGMVGLP